MTDKELILKVLERSKQIKLLKDRGKFTKEQQDRFLENENLAKEFGKAVLRDKNVRNTLLLMLGYHIREMFVETSKKAALGPKITKVQTPGGGAVIKQLHPNKKET